MSRTFILQPMPHPSRRLCAEYVMQAPDGHWVTFSEPKKKREQEEKYHAQIGDIAKQCDYHLRKLSRESWKRLLVEAFVNVMRDQAKAQGKPDPFPRGGALLPSLDGLRIVQVEVLTRDFTVSQASEFIEYLYAFGADRGVTWSEPATPPGALGGN